MTPGGRLGDPPTPEAPNHSAFAHYTLVNGTGSRPTSMKQGSADDVNKWFFFMAKYEEQMMLSHFSCLSSLAISHQRTEQSSAIHGAIV